MYNEVNKKWGLESSSSGQGDQEKLMRLFWSIVHCSFTQDLGDLII